MTPLTTTPQSNLESRRVKEFDLKNYSYASDLGHSVPSRKEARVLCKNGEAESYCYKGNNNCWLNQVNDKWNIFMYQQAHNRGSQILSDEVKKQLSGDLMGGSGGDGKP